ncbi:immunoglobulin-like domain-containing protein [Bacillus badius]|uniref:Bacterial Ig-like domain-containing protein n=1 Tax=Bacillus badius TaxID=1455 RepID=A0ABR5APG0_BACBA|nr:immunoglobulin-like domain-containing protein [Bacillus badius]KIL74236.1 hypothetical protein SD77_2891 [Bacillus badius]KZO00624.1 hypothetical protein A4244_15030 [Bacillus badius]KZR57461.1 hypothetical protein A3781_20090 [Bacillus badius]MED0666936.1 hypothetical protein [Bacillus badius]MED4717289.1 hypothetical protein [Bacillus badius]
MKSKLIPCIALFFLILAGCQNQGENLTKKAEIQEMPSEKDGVTLSANKNEYTTSTDKITVVNKNESDSKVKSSHGIFLEKNVDGTWYEFPYKEPAFSEVLRYLPPGKSHTFDIHIDELEYELTPGEYRAVHEGLAAPFEVVE